MTMSSANYYLLASSAQADSLARPFWRRLLSILRPALVAIRFIKPCSLERWRFLG